MLIVNGCSGAFKTNLPDSITIGWEADQYAYDIPLDISQEMARWPGSVPVLIYSRPGEKNTVQPAVTTLSGTTLYWSPDAYATAIHGGSGAAQIVFTTAGDPVIVGHSKVIKLAIFASLEASEDPPEPYETWIQSLLDAAAEAVGAAEAAIAAAEMIKTITASATTLPAGSQATASYGDGHLSLGIPKGDKGDTGETGATPDLTIGTVTTLPAGSAATAEITGTPEDPVLSLGIPEGDQGERGPIGPTPNLTIGTVTTLPTGSDATAEITGTPEAPVLNLGLPRGEPGEVTEAQLQAVSNSKADVIVENINGAFLHFKDGANNAPIKSAKIKIRPLILGSSDTPTAETPKPLKGWEACKIDSHNVNMWDDRFFWDVESNPMTLKTDPTAVDYGFYGGIVALWRENFPMGTTRDEDANTGYWKTPVYFPEQVTVIGDLCATNSFTYRVQFKYGYGPVANSSNIAASVLPNQSRVGRTSEANRTCIGVRITTTAGDTNGRARMKDIEISFVSDSDGKYNPPVAHYYTITFPNDAGTVYGGELEINEDGTGTLKTYPYYASYNGEELTGEWISSLDEYAEGTTPTIGAQVVDMSGAVVQTFQLSNLPQITTLLGINNIWADAGIFTEFVYRADTKLYIDKKIAAALAGS